MRLMHASCTGTLLHWYIVALGTHVAHVIALQRHDTFDRDDGREPLPDVLPLQPWLPVLEELLLLGWGAQEKVWISQCGRGRAEESE